MAEGPPLIFQTVKNLGVMKKMKVDQEGILGLFIVLGGLKLGRRPIFAHGHHLVMCSTGVLAEGPHTQSPRRARIFWRQKIHHVHIKCQSRLIYINI